MYDLNRQVVIVATGELGRITERNYMTGPAGRHATYVVDLGNGRDAMTGSASLRAADYQCDGCDRWCAGAPYATGPDGEYPDGLHFCFLCAGPPFERDARRRELAALDREARAEARMGGVPVEEALDVLSRAALTPAPGRS